MTQAARGPAGILPDDQTLTESGLTLQAGKSGQVLIIACGALAREVLALIEVNRWEHISLTCLPAILHNSPDKITPAVRDLVLAHRDQFQQIFVAYADCGTGGLLAAECARLGVRMIAGPHCYSFFEGNERFAAHGEMTAFYLTDFLARQFEAFVIRPLGLDRHPGLRDTYFGNYTKLVYLAQTEDAALDGMARAAAERLGLAYERRFTGYGDLARTMQKAAQTDATRP